jgi:hypothetical protein
MAIWPQNSQIQSAIAPRWFDLEFFFENEFFF